MAQRTQAPDWLPVMIVVGLWAAVVPWIGPLLGIDLDSRLSARVVSHLVPGVASAVAATLLWLRAERGIEMDVVAYTSLLLAAAAGALMFALHLTLLRDDFREGTFPSSRVLLHVPPGPVIIALAMWGMVTGAASAARSRASARRGSGSVVP